MRYPTFKDPFHPKSPEDRVKDGRSAALVIGWITAALAYGLYQLLIVLLDEKRPFDSVAYGCVFVFGCYVIWRLARMAIHAGPHDWRQHAE